jgi:hypothetical protein
MESVVLIASIPDDFTANTHLQMMLWHVPTANGNHKYKNAFANITNVINGKTHFHSHFSYVLFCSLRPLRIGAIFNGLGLG